MIRSCLAAVIACLLFVGCGGGDDCLAGTPVFASVPKPVCNAEGSGAPVVAVAKPAVTYEVTGTAATTDVTYANREGGTQQEQVTLPWSTSFQGIAGSQLYLSALFRADSSTTITVRIIVDGMVKRTSVSSGTVGVANASTTCC